VKAVFLDRDGTINQDPEGYISRIDQFHLFPFTAQAIRIFNTLGLKTIVITNQSGIARGLFTAEQVDTLHNYMLQTLAAEDAHLDLVLYSPYFAGGNTPPYNIHHPSRKPGTGMFFQALKHFPISAKNSYMIGDKPEDIEFGKTNGLTTFLVKTGMGSETWELQGSEKGATPDFVVENILSAANVIKLLERSKSPFPAGIGGTSC